MTQPQFGDTAAIEERRKQEARQEFNEAMEALFVRTRLPWPVMGYHVASAADAVTDWSGDIQDWLDFQAGFNLYLKEQGQ